MITRCYGRGANSAWQVWDWIGNGLKSDSLQDGKEEDITLDIQKKFAD